MAGERALEYRDHKSPLYYRETVVCILYTVMLHLLICFINIIYLT